MKPEFKRLLIVVLVVVAVTQVILFLTRAA